MVVLILKSTLAQFSPAFTRYFAVTLYIGIYCLFLLLTSASPRLVYLSFSSLTQLNLVVQCSLSILLSQSPKSLDSMSVAPRIALVPLANFHIKLVSILNFYLNI